MKLRLYQLADDEKVYGKNTGRFILVGESDEEVSGPVRTKAEAQRIVRAVNAHDALVKAVRETRRKWGALQDIMTDLIEERGLITEATLPGDYQALVEALADATELEALTVNALKLAEDK